MATGTDAVEKDESHTLRPVDSSGKSHSFRDNSEGCSVCVLEPEEAYLAKARIV